MSGSRLGWGLLGTGRIAETFAAGLEHSRTGKLVAAAGRNRASGDAFAEKFPSLRVHAGYEKLLADPAVQAVYICTPHPFHAEWCVRAARAGKHILCEKPLAMDRLEAVAVARAARDHRVFLMEAFMYRCHPQTARLVELIREGAIGKVGVIQATFSFQAEFAPESRYYHPALGGGGILDVGCYTTSIARLIAGAATGRPFANALRLLGQAVLHPETGVDLYATAMMEFPEGILAQLACGVGLWQENGVRVFGTEGALHLPTPFVISREGGTSTIFVTRGQHSEPEAIPIHSEHPLYALEADAVGDTIARGERECAVMTLEDTLGNMAALDAWRASGYRDGSR